MKKLVIIYETKEGKEIHRDWNNLYVPKETDLVSFKNIDSPNIFEKTKETLFFVANVEFRVPDVVVITLFSE